MRHSKLFVGVLKSSHARRKILKGRGLETAVGDEGGLLLVLFDGTEDGVEIIIAAIEAVVYVPGKGTYLSDFDVHHREFAIKEHKSLRLH